MYSHICTVTYVQSHMYSHICTVTYVHCTVTYVQSHMYSHICTVTVLKQTYVQSQIIQTYSYIDPTTTDYRNSTYSEFLKINVIPKLD